MKSAYEEISSIIFAISIIPFIVYFFDTSKSDLYYKVFKPKVDGKTTYKRVPQVWEASLSWFVFVTAASFLPYSWRFAVSALLIGILIGRVLFKNNS